MTTKTFAGPTHPAFRGAGRRAEMGRAVHQLVGLHESETAKLDQVWRLVAEAAPAWNGRTVFPRLKAWGIAPDEHGHYRYA